MTRGLRFEALTLGAANAVEFGLQFLLPVLLARVLDKSDFGVYRLFWLVTATSVAFSAWGVPASLYYFLPRSEPERKRLYVDQVIVFLLMTGTLAALAVIPGSPLLPGNAKVLADLGLLPSLFVLLWIVATLLDCLPAAEGQVVWQAKAVVSLAVVRVLLVGGAALWLGGLHAVLWAFTAFAAFKVSLMLVYRAQHHGWRAPHLTRATFREQLTYALPFGLASMLFSLRAQADQWVAAALFSVGQYAALSVAATLSPLVTLFRHSMSQVFLHRMSKQHADGDTAAMLAMNNQSNVVLALMLFPLLALAFAFSDALIALIYSRAYVEGANAMRVYVLGMVATSLELNNIMLLLKEGRFAIRLNLLTLAVAVAASLAGAHAFGLTGAAIGSVCALFLDRFLTLQRIGRKLALPVGEIQDWTSLSKILLAAGAAALSAWVVTPAGLPLLIRLVAASIVLLISYVIALAALGVLPLVRQIVAGRRG